MRTFQLGQFHNFDINLEFDDRDQSPVFGEKNETQLNQLMTSSVFSGVLPSDFTFFYDDASLYLSDVNSKTPTDDTNTGPSEELIPTDPLFASQWHLNNNTAGQFDINVTEVWDDYTGEGIQVIVADTGSDYGHADLAGNYRTDIDYDYTSGDFDPSPSTGQNHGTAVLGIIGAIQGNGIGTVGVAYDATLVNYRGFGLGSSYGDDLFLDAAGLGDGIGNTAGNGNGSDIVSMSGGFGSSVFITDANADDAINALDTVTANGRDGLGLLFIKSSGNSRAAANSTAREEGTAERYDSTEFSINVAAMRQDGWVTDFSTPGANVLISAFADDINNNSAIVATDRTGADGYSAADHTTTFGGTSAAAPQVAGVVALMLEANSDLGWRDVQTILAMTARHTGSDVGSAANTGAPAGGGHEQATQLDGSTWFWNDASNWNGGGMHFSNDYGYGMVDALAAVRLAESWELQSTSANDVSTFEDDVNTSVTYDNASQTFVISEATNIVMEHVSIDLDFQTTYLADIEIYLVSPSGTRVQLLADTGDSGDYDGRWRFGTTAFAGEESAGDWDLIIVDDATGDPLTIRDADLRTSGSAINNNDLFVLTNEFSDYAGVAGHATAFIGNGAGTNTLNAAAVTAASTINLVLNTGTIDGIAITNSEIHRVFTGDGDDIITGDSVSNFYSTGRGADTVTGFSNDDTIVGGRGNDILDGQDGTDYAVYSGVQANYTITDIGGGSYTIADNVGEDGTDTVTNIEFASFTDGDFALAAPSPTFTEGNDNEDGTAGDDVLDALGGNDIVNGLGGNDTINGGTGNDNLRGNDGDDTLNGDDGSDFLNGGAGADALNGGAGFDSADYRTAAAGVALNANTGGTGGEANGDTYSSIERYYGSDFNDTITTTSANEFIFGGDGNDVINAGDGIDRVYGDAGNDIQRGDAGNDLLFGSAGNDQLNGGIGYDVATYDNATSRVVVNLGTGGTFGDAAGDTYFGIEAVYGTDFNDNITGSSGTNELRGLDGDDTLIGDGGNDRLFGGNGADFLVGGTGVDIAMYTLATAGVNLNLATGGTTGEATGDTYSSIEWVFGSNFDDVITGSTGANRLLGNDGDDFLIGDGGNDRLLGGDGNDIVNGGDGVDALFGQAGVDTINGGNGNDFMYGSAGADAFNGGADFDTVSYLASSSGVTVNMQTGSTGGDAAGDTYSSVERLLGTGLSDNITGSNGNESLLGNGGADYITGGLGNDSINGGAGVDAFGYNTTQDDADAISGFTLTEVIYILGGDTDFDTFAEVMAVASDAGSNVIFNFGGGNTLTIVGHNMAALDAGNFDFGGVPPMSEAPDNKDNIAEALDAIESTVLGSTDNNDVDMASIFDMDAGII